MKVGQRVKHAVYGEGTIINVFDTKTVAYGEEPNTVGPPRYEGNLNVAVQFDNGGPMGWAFNSSNDTRELQEL